MPKTEVKKIESEDLKELADEALDRTMYAQACGCICGTVATAASSSPAE